MGLSPMMQHYVRIKEKHEDCLIFYRLGDFYELFFDDAVTASRELELTLTGRDCGLEERAPMCGVPFHAVDGYIAKLVEKGYKIAICEQLTQPVPGTLVERDVVRIMTAGTLTENNLLDEKSNNYICAVFYDEANQSVGISWCDISTGEFNYNKYHEKAFETLSDTLVRIAPTEIICNEPMLELSYKLQAVASGIVPRFSLYRDTAWEYSAAQEAIAKFVDAAELKEDGLAVCAAGALLSYIKDTQKQEVSNIELLSKENAEQFLYLDALTRKNLELTSTIRERKSTKGTLLWLLDHTQTAMGKRLLRKWIEQPLFDEVKINERLDCVEELSVSTMSAHEIAEALSSVRDIERLSAKISYKSINPRDMTAIAQSLERLPQLKILLGNLHASMFQQMYRNFDELDDICALLTNAIVKEPPVFVREGGFIREGFDPELDELMLASKEGSKWISALEAAEREASGIKNLKIGYNRIFGYYIEVTKSQTGLVPYRYQRRQTLSNCERYITEELKELEEKILTSQSKSLEVELALFEKLCNVLTSAVPRLQKMSRYIAAVDCLVSFALVSIDRRYTRPTLTRDGVLEIKEGRHPTLEAIIEEKFVPNDTYLNRSEDRIMIITGPNMAGKSTYMRQVALLVIMAQIGCFVPATKANIALTDRIFTRIGASDDLLTGQSTFMVEMLEVANIVNNATENSLLLLDEIGRGTSTYDGLSIAWSVMEYLSQSLNAKTLFSTHYHELTELEQRLSGVKNYRVTIKEYGGKIIFLHRIARGSAQRSYGIEVASLAGLKESIVNRARVILKNLQANDINSAIADKVLDRQTSMFESMSASAKSFAEMKDILSTLDFNNLTPMQAMTVLVDLAERMADAEA